MRLHFHCETSLQDATVSANSQEEMSNPHPPTPPPLPIDTKQALSKMANTYQLIYWLRWVRSSREPKPMNISYTFFAFKVSFVQRESETCTLSFKTPFSALNRYIEVVSVSSCEWLTRLSSPIYTLAHLVFCKLLIKKVGLPCDDVFFFPAPIRCWILLVTKWQLRGNASGVISILSGLS